jgi:Icc-related predicted phosphoesterase
MRPVNKLLALAGLQGDVARLGRVLEAEGTSVDAVAIVGDLAAPWSEKGIYREVFRLLGQVEKPTFWVPGASDAPVRDYLQESFNMEVVYPFLHGVHGTFATAPGHVVFAGLGGEIVDDPNTIRAEEALLRYPGWEAEYRLKVLSELDEHPIVLMFATAPAHKGLGDPGSEVVAELIKTYSPHVAIVGGGDPKQEQLGRSLVVCPGSLAQGDYALVEVKGKKVEQRHASEPATVES